MFNRQVTFLLVIFCSALVASVYSKDSTPVEQCGPEKLFTNVAIYSSYGLCTSMPCQMLLGDKLKVDIEFKNKNKVEKIHSKCIAKILASEIPFPLPDAENGCASLTNTKCPVEPNTDIKMTLIVPVEEPQAKKGVVMLASMKVFLEDQNSQVISCFKLSANIKL